MRRDRKPVLTSPWKIGVLVALLLLVTNSAVAYYMVGKYGIDLDWIGSGGRIWGIDSYGFFREMFPLVASVLVCSLVAYFAIASAVRRYRYYIDSGQDYRKMISLADSIDDLTNPSQIASLSDYPDFQAILRNYGDQIREISKEIDENYEMMDSTELEKEMEALLEGRPVLESVSGDRWWKEKIRKLSVRLEKDSGELEDLRSDNEENRKIISSVALSIGRITETVEEARANLSDIMALADDLDSQERVAGSGAENAAGMSDSHVEKAMADIKSSLERLAQGGAAMNDFSETTNGLALNIALLAARGNIEEKELASFAEKARNTSEKFKKLSSAVQSLAGKLSADFTKVRGWAEGFASAPAVDKSDMTDIKNRVKECVSGLNRNMENLLSDAETVEQLMSQGAGEEAQPQDYSDQSESWLTEGSAGIEETVANEDADSDELEILRSDGFEADRGGEWDGFESAGMDEESEMSPPADKPAGEGDFQEPSVSMEQEDESIEIDDNEPAASTEDMQTEDQMWASLNISGEEESGEDIGIDFRENNQTESGEQAEQEKMAERPEMEEQPEGEKTFAIDPDSVTGVEVAYDEFLDRSVGQQEQAVENAEESSAADEEDDPIIDLYELGAVEISGADITQ